MTDATACAKAQPMIPIIGATAKPLSKTTLGHMLVLLRGTFPALALRAIDERTPTIGCVVWLAKPALPTFEWIDHDPACVDLGIAEIRIFDLQSFTSATDASAAGNLEIQQNSVCIISTDSMQSSETVVDVATGAIRNRNAHWYARHWAVGIMDRGQFHQLYEWPPATPGP